MVTRFKSGGLLEREVYEYMRLVPACIEGYEERKRAAQLALAAARKADIEGGQTPEGAARAFLERLGEAVGGGGALRLDDGDGGRDR